MSIALHDHVACAKVLLQHERFGFEDNQKFNPVWRCIGAEYYAADEGLPMLKLLLSFGFDPNEVVKLPKDTCSTELPVLHLALYHGHVNCAVTLVQVILSKLVETNLHLGSSRM